MPPDLLAVSIRLVAELYKTPPRVIVNSGATALVVGGYAAWRVGDVLLGALTLATCVPTFALLPVLRAGRSRIPHAGPAEAIALERRFGLTSCAVALGIGLMCARAFVIGSDHAVDMIMSGLMLACIGTVSRNYFRPWIVFAQLALLAGPSVLGLLVQREAVSALLALGTLAYAYNVVETTLELHRGAVAAFGNEELVRAQNIRFDAALGNMVQGLCMFDASERLVVRNQRYLDMFGFAADLAEPGTSLRTLLERSVAVGNHPGRTAEELHEAHRRYLANPRSLSVEADLRGGRAILIHLQPMPGGGWVATHEDVTEQRAYEAQITHAARHDVLTGLPNRAYFRERLERALTTDPTGRVGVLLLDLDRFKIVNDTLGHPAGDELLHQVTDRVLRCLEGGDLLARLGGDEFAIVQIAQEQPVMARRLARRIVRTLSHPFAIEGQEVVVGGSVGIALAPEGGGEPDQLLKQADLALYSAKEDGRGRYRIYAERMSARLEARSALETELRRALAMGEFELHYQPIVRACSGELTGFEALVRWRHPERGLLLPDGFIAIAEEVGLIAPLGEWIVREALREAARWRDPLSVAVNVSPAQFRDQRLLATITQALARCQVAPSRLQIEITESLLLADTGPTLAVLHGLKKLGVRIVMDDFGTGYSSLSSLRSFPFDKLKIDRSFVRDVATNPESAAIVRAIVHLAHTVGMVTTAEGVETEEQMDFLRREGCTEAQGYLLGRPEPGRGWSARVVEAEGDGSAHARHYLPACAQSRPACVGSAR